MTRLMRYVLGTLLILVVYSSQLFAETQIYYIHTDHLGTPQVLTDQDKKVVWRADYQPFGKAVVDEDPDGDGVKVEMPLRLPGQYADSETGYSYNYFRDYDPTLGRYVQSDPIGLAGGLNTYTYVSNNPLRYIDPFGLNQMNRSPYAPGGPLAPKPKEDTCGCWKKAFLGIDDAIVGSGIAGAGALTGPFKTKPRTGISGGGRAGMRTSVFSDMVHQHNMRHGKTATSRAARNIGRKVFTRAIPGVGTLLFSWDIVQYEECRKNCKPQECSID